MLLYNLLDSGQDITLCWDNCKMYYEDEAQRVFLDLQPPHHIHLSQVLFKVPVPTEHVKYQNCQGVENDALLGRSFLDLVMVSLM